MRCLRVAAFGLVLMVFAPAAHAQSDPPSDQGVLTIFGDIARDFVHLPSRATGIWLGVAGGAALAGHALDDELSSAPGEEWDRWSEAFDPGTYIGNGFVLAGGAAATYAVGRFADKPRAAHLGRDLLRAQLMANVLVHGIKQAARRERPDASQTFSFPSGHAAGTFASAVVLHRHLKGRWTIPVYAAATYVGIARMHENKHYLSDVMFGSAIGIASGLTVTRHVGTEEWTISPAATRGGAALVVNRSF